MQAAPSLVGHGTETSVPLQAASPSRFPLPSRATGLVQLRLPDVTSAMFPAPGFTLSAQDWSSRSGSDWGQLTWPFANAARTQPPPLSNFRTPLVVTHWPASVTFV